MLTELLTSKGSRWGNTSWLCKSLVLNGSTQSFGASLRRTGYNFHYLASCPWVFLFTWFSPRSCSTCGSRLPWSSCWRRGSPPSGRTSSSWPRRARRTPSRAFRCRGNTNHIHTLRKDLWTGKVILLFSVSIQFWTPVYKRSLSQNYWAVPLRLHTRHWDNLSTSGSIDGSGRVRARPARLGRLNPVPRIHPRTQVKYTMLQ